MKKRPVEGPGQVRLLFDNYKPGIFLATALLLTIAATAQVDTTKVLQQINAHGYSYKNVAVDSSFGIPNDTFLLKSNNRRALAFKNEILYHWDSTSWKPIARKLNDTTLIINGDTVNVGGTGGGSADGNNFPSSLSFNATTRTLTLTRTGLSALTQVFPIVTGTDAGLMSSAQKATLDSAYTKVVHANIAQGVENAYYRSGVLIEKDTSFNLGIHNSGATGAAVLFPIGSQTIAARKIIDGTNSTVVQTDSSIRIDVSAVTAAAIRDSVTKTNGGRTDVRYGGGVARGTLSGGGTANAVETISWAELLSGNHTSMYIDSVRVDPSSNEIVIYYPAVANVISVIPYTDDQFGDVGIFASGAGMGTTQARFKMKRLIPAYMILTGNGSTWVASGLYNGDYSVSYTSGTGLFSLTTTNINSQILTDANSQGMIRGYSWSDTTTAYYNVRKYPGTASRGYYEVKFDLRDGFNNVFTGAPATTNEFYIALPPYWGDVELRTFDSRTSQQNRNFWSQTNIWFVIVAQK